MPYNKKLIYRLIAVTTLAALAILNFVIAGTFAYWRAAGTALNELSTGEVEGAIVEVYDEAEAKNLTPGSTVEKVVNVENTGTIDMVVRVQITKSWTDDPSLDADMILIDFDTSMWYDAGDGYYYYMGVLSPGDTTEVALMESFSISTSASNEYQGQSAEIVVSMEALQATASAISDVWDIDYTLLGVELTEAETPDPISIEFTSNKEFVFGNDGDLFSAFQTLVPGETRTQEITITNSSDEAVEIFFFSSELTGSSELLEFLEDYVTITIVDEDGTTIYTGPLNSANLQQEISLGTFAAGETRSFYIELEVDPAADNTYQSLMAENIQWTFVAQGEDADTTTATSSSSSSSTMPKTGDNSWVITLCASLGVVAAIMAVLLGLKLRKETEEQAEQLTA